MAFDGRLGEATLSFYRGPFRRAGPLQRLVICRPSPPPKVIVNFLQPCLELQDATADRMSERHHVLSDEEHHSKRNDANRDG